MDLYVDVSNRQPELLGTFHDDPSEARFGPGAWPARIVEYHIEEILPWGNNTTLSKYNERQKKDGKIIKVSTTAENKTIEKTLPHTRRHYLYITKIDGKSKIVEVAW